MGGQAARVRLFRAGEFSAPTGWPDDVGIAVISAGERLEVFPVHAREGMGDALARLAALSGHDLREALCHPAVEDHAACELPFSAVADLLAAVEAFLARFPAAVEEAEDFAINFDFAADEGIPFPALIPPDAPEPDPARPTRVLPAGFHPFDVAAHATLRPFLRVDPAGDLLVVPDAGLPVLSATTADILLRDDGLALALPALALCGPQAMQRAIRLPHGCLGWMPRHAGQDIPLLAVTQGDYVILSLLPEWAWPEPVIRPAETRPSRWIGWQAIRNTLGAAWRMRLVGALTLSTLVIGAFWLGDGPPPESPRLRTVEVLRAGLFD